MSAKGPLNDLYALNFSVPTGIMKSPQITWQQIDYNIDYNTTQQIEPHYLSATFSISQNEDSTTYSKFIFYGGLTSDSTTTTTTSCTGCLYVYEVETNLFWVVRPNGTAPNPYPVVGVTSSSGLFFYDGEIWTRYQSGVCSDAVLSLYEECDDGISNLGDNCESCYIQMCGNYNVDPGEECDGGPLCTTTCTCPPPFFSDGSKRNGCIPASTGVAFILMILFPVILLLILIGIVINFVIYTQRANKSIVKVLFL